MKITYSLSPKTICVISIVLLMQLDSIDSRPLLQRNQENLTENKMQINQLKPLEEITGRASTSAADRSINKAPDTQPTRPTNELQVPPPKDQQHSIDDYDQQDDAKMSDQLFMEIYYKTLQKERKTREANDVEKSHSLEEL
ncbi:hypothetical protein DAPPUDRAFT_312170 [Daphnia pulex]|uniref:Uncharacterized protein n=1 Tax=Daphnia pulex TaxID=6669 RepID=E9FZ24_DAPPU|nr:hypothetical protein DAPPUDRAFT_312170 [Daphnia pulex]|eukprot:EFX87637.1 hypothetical protein DAPPUDRAFT_312170 [Daphnia pulex]